MKKTNLNCFLPSFQDNSGHENSYLKVYEKLSKIKSFNIELFVAKNNTIKTTLKKNSIFFKNRNFFFLKIFNIFRNLKVINKISKLSKKETVFLLDGHSFYFLLAFILSLTNSNKFKKLILFCRYNYKGIQKMIFKFFVFFLKEKFSESILIVDNNLNYKIFIAHNLEFKKLKLHKKNINKKKIKILYPSSMYNYKNHEIIVRLLKGYMLKNINFYFTCSKKEFEPYKNIKNLYRINYFDNKNLEKVYNQYDAIIFPSLIESLGLPIIEATQMRMPILVSDLPYSREINSNCIKYFNPKSTKSLYKTIYNLFLN